MPRLGRGVFVDKNIDKYIGGNYNLNTNLNIWWSTERGVANA
jgi:hypothetical protein